MYCLNIYLLEYTSLFNRDSKIVLFLIERTVVSALGPCIYLRGALRTCVGAVACEESVVFAACHFILCSRRITTIIVLSNQVVGTGANCGTRGA
jgi:hypothetical protein